MCNSISLGEKCFQELNQFTEVALLLSFIPSFFPFIQLSGVSKRVSVQSVDEDDRMDDDWEVTRTQQGDDIDLFEDGEESHSSTNGTHRQLGENIDIFCGPGKEE